MEKDEIPLLIPKSFSVNTVVWSEDSERLCERGGSSSSGLLLDTDGQTLFYFLAGVRCNVSLCSELYGSFTSFIDAKGDANDLLSCKERNK